MLENRMVIDDDNYIEKDDEEYNIFDLIDEECELFDRWEEEQC